MNKKVLIFKIVACSLFAFIFQIDAMVPYGTSKGMQDSRDRVEREKKEKEKKKEQIIADLERSGEKNTIYIYDESLKHHRVLLADQWSKSMLLKERMEVVLEKGLTEPPSQAIFLDISAKAMSSIHLILDTCGGSKEDDAFCVNIEAGSLDFDSLVSVVGFMHNFDVIETIIDPFIKNVQQRLMDVCKGKLQLTEENIRMFDNANSEVRKNTLIVPWSIFLEKMRLNIAKSKKLGNGPKFCSCGIPNSYITDILISPDNKHVLVVPPGADLWVNDRRLQVKVSVLNSNGAIEWELPLIIDHPIWINNNKFVYRHEYDSPQKLIIADNVTKTSQEIVFDSTKKNVKKIMLHKEEILFSYLDDQNKLGVGTYDQESKKTTYRSLGDFSGDVLGIDEVGRLLLYNKKKGIVYRLKIIDNALAEQMLTLTPSDNILSLMASPDGKKIAVRRARSLNVEIYSLKTGEKIEYLCNFTGYRLKFSEDSQYLIVAGDKVIIFSALTKEIIGELDSSRQPIFKHNSAVALSADNNTLVMGSTSNRSSFQSLVGTMPNNVLIWDFIPKKYLPAWKKLQNLPPLLEYIYPIVSWYYRSQNEKMPIKFSKAEKGTFHGFDVEIQQLLTAIGIIAPGQLGKPKNTIPASIVAASEEPGVKSSQQQESMMQKINKLMHATGMKMKDFWNSMNKIFNALPGSG